jgi:tRNA (mo5U34)-methyltransferase
MSDAVAQRRHNSALAGLKSTGLYHSIPLPDGRVLQGSMSMELQQKRLASFRLPERLEGKRVLDIGPWDGFFTFEMERRGADVTAVDYADLDTFRALHQALGSRARYLRMDAYEIHPDRLGTFDIVLCLGLLYHLKHPLLGLERICAVTRDVCIIDTFVVDAGSAPAPIPYIEFYEHDELGGELDNWSGPTTSAVAAMARSAGFAQAEVLGVVESTAQVAAYRTWRNLPASNGTPTALAGLSCHSHPGRCFDSRKEEYIVLWCPWTNAAAPSLDEIFPEVDGHGVSPLACTRLPDGLNISCRVPPGLAAGRHEARLRIGTGDWSESHEFYCDLPAMENELRLTCIQDGMNWTLDEVESGWMTLWVEGLSAEADGGNTVVEIDEVPHFAESVLPDTGQVNIKLRPVIRAGMRGARVLHRGAVSGVKSFRVMGDRPAIRGLEDIW